MTPPTAFEDRYGDYLPLPSATSPTMLLGNHEKSVFESSVKKDLILKRRIRILKFFSRILSFLCSLTVIILSSISLSIFLSTRSLPPISTSVAWPPSTTTWPAVLVLVVASLSFITSSAILVAYCIGGHRRAEKTSLADSVVAMLGFVVAVVVWAVVGGVFMGTKDVKTGKDMWGWACADTTEGQKLRRERYSGLVDYGLVCRLQDWNFICTIIHVAAETFTVAVYAYSAWRIYKRMKAAKAMRASA